MSSASLLGGARASIGQAGHASIQSFIGQSLCTAVGDRENDRTHWGNLGAVESSESLSCSFSGYAKGPRCSRLIESAPAACGFARYSGVAKFGSHSSATLSRNIGSLIGENCRSSYLPSSSVTSYPAPRQRGWEGTTAKVLGLPSLTARCPPSLNANRGIGLAPKKLTRSKDHCSGPGQRKSITAMALLPDEGKKALNRPDYSEAADLQLMKEWTANPYLRSPGSESDPFWEHLNMVIRVIYAIAMYGGLVVAGTALCTFTGVDCWGGFKPSIETFVQALGWAIPPMMVLLLILEDEVVKVCPPARAIRDVEDEELMDFFVGMNPWQFVFVVAAGSLAEELFFRVAIQGGLAHALQSTAKGVDEASIGVSALTTMVPFFAPFAQAFAAVLTASLTGSMYYIIASPKDPTYVIAPVSINKHGWNNRRDIKKRIEAWYERRQLRKIYSPLMEALLALYLGFEWVQTGNIFGPMITHTLYSLVVAGNGLRRIHDNRFKLRQRVSQVTQPKEVNPDVMYVDKLN